MGFSTKNPRGENTFAPNIFETVREFFVVLRLLELEQCILHFLKDITQVRWVKGLK